MPTTTRYEAHYELEDERIFSLRYFCKVWPATRWDPEDVDMGDFTYYLDGEEIAGSAIPDVITDIIIDKMIDDAKPLPTEYDGYPDD